MSVCYIDCTLFNQKSYFFEMYVDSSQTWVHPQLMPGSISNEYPQLTIYKASQMSTNNSWKKTSQMSTHNSWQEASWMSTTTPQTNRALSLSLTADLQSWTPIFGAGTPILWRRLYGFVWWDSLRFGKESSVTPVFKILVRALDKAS